MTGDPSAAPDYEALLRDASPALFASLRRSDQRRTAVQYLRGLLEVEGRKSMRHLGVRRGGRTGDQRFHHFIHASPWDWVPVRRALAELVARQAECTAWVVREHPTVGPDGTHAIWACGEAFSTPVGWRLDARGGEVAEAVRDLGLARQPVVVDAPRLDAVEVMRGLRSGDVPFLVRVPGLHPAPRRFGRWVTAELVTRERVHSRVLAGAELTLVAVGPADAAGPVQYWLTDLTGAHPVALLRLARLPQRVDEALARVGRRVGIGDFSGRSAGGWHRHTTLASVAHAMVALTAAGEGFTPPAR